MSEAPDLSKIPRRPLCHLDDGITFRKDFIAVCNPIRILTDACMVRSFKYSGSDNNDTKGL